MNGLTKAILEMIGQGGEVCRLALFSPSFLKTGPIQMFHFHLSHRRNYRSQKKKKTDSFPYLQSSPPPPPPNLDSYHSLAYTSLQHLRRRSLSLEEPLLFNSFLYSLKARARAEPSVAAFWKYLREGDRDEGDGGRGRRQEGVGLIRFEEDVVARESKVSEMEARQFWEGL